MGNGGTKWTLGSAFGINMNPLMITRRIRKLVDTLLRDLHAGARAQGRTNEVIEVRG